MKKLRELTKYEKSALIGYWRNGCDMNLIAEIFGLTVNEIEKIINEQTANTKTIHNY